MSGGIEKGRFLFTERKDRLLGKNGDPAFPLQHIGIKKSIAVIDPSRPAQAARSIKDSLRKVVLPAST